MDYQNNGLWQGGRWENGSPIASPPPVEIPQPTAAVLRPRRRRRRRLPWYGWLFIALFAVGVVGTAIQWAEDYSMPSLPDYFQDDFLEDQEEHRSDVPPAIPQAETGSGFTLTLLGEDASPLSYQEIYQQVLPSIVSISSYTRDGYSTGTGIVLSADGYIVTNAHVVAEAQQVEVFLHDNRNLEASLVGFDAKEDLAVLKLEVQGLTPARFGDSHLLRCGDPVAALGDSLGYRSTITNGIVSAVDRELDMDGVSMALIQTSAAINFGNSGGALINQYGQVVGVTTIKIVAHDGSAEALGFAIPSRRVKYVADTLIDGREVTPGVFGITVSTYLEEGGGLSILEVAPWSDAAQKGIRKGDVLLAVNGQPIASAQDLSRLKLDRGAGDTVELTYRRSGQTAIVEIALSAPPAD